MGKVLASEDRLIRGGRSAMGRSDAVEIGWCDLIGSAMGRSAMGTYHVDGAVDIGSDGSG